MNSIMRYVMVSEFGKHLRTLTSCECCYSVCAFGKVSIKQPLGFGLVGSSVTGTEITASAFPFGIGRQVHQGLRLTTLGAPSLVSSTCKPAFSSSLLSATPWIRNCAMACWFSSLPSHRFRIANTPHSRRKDVFPSTCLLQTTLAPTLSTHTDYVHVV